MARMHSRKKGKSGSHKPVHKIAPWVKYKPDEIEQIIVKLAKQGYSTAKIGLILRDQYGIPTIRINKIKLSSILKKHGLAPTMPEDLYNLIKKAINLQAHLQKNKKDYTSKRGFEITESKIRRLAKYYIRAGILPADWKWDIEQAKLIVK
ncbi:MAG: 30S ribosomal protein S15 [Candidatus Aenigmatarchaeota archaeon]